MMGMVQRPEVMQRPCLKVVAARSRNILVRLMAAYFYASGKLEVIAAKSMRWVEVNAS